jgi:ParB family transcriptional regulator, chromosome partitioning protein
MPQPATKPPSPEHSSTKSKPVRARLADAALNAADRTFGSAPRLPLADGHPPAPPSLDGRRRLNGAFSIAIDRVRPDPTQPRRRFDTAAQAELVESIKRLGILQPITVRYIEEEAAYQVITGERRYQAAREAGLAEIPCWLQNPKEQDVLLHQIVENWQRLDMHPYDLADALARLRDVNGYSQRDLVRETSKSEGEISKIFALLDLDPVVQQLARSDETGRITRRHLYAVRTLPPEEQLTLLRRTQQEAVTATDIEAIVARRNEDRGIRKRRGAPVSHHRFPTSQALVTITFRKKDVSTDDVLAALEEVRSQLGTPPQADEPA